MGFWGLHLFAKQVVGGQMNRGTRIGCVEVFCVVVNYVSNGEMKVNKVMFVRHQNVPNCLHRLNLNQM